MDVVCVYRKGVLKPLRKVKLREGERVEIRIEEKPKALNKFFGIFKRASVDVDRDVDEMFEARA